MRKSQWVVLAIIFSGMTLLYAYWTFSCDHWAMKSQHSWDTWFIIGRICLAFAWFTAGLAIISWINAWLEGEAEKKERGLS
jgi:hypothetical protein